MASQQQSVEQFRGQARLPKFAVPRRYDLTLKPDLVACTFAGAVNITLDVVADTRFLVLNAADLTVHNSAVSFKSGGQERRPTQIIAVEQDEILVLLFDEVLPQGEGVLRITFDGTLNDNLKVLMNTRGEKKNMAVTQFEPADARRCFPCWDEPAFKAIFRVTLKVPSELVALSNMPVVEEKFDGPAKTISFQESPIMSTYLVAVVIGLFDYVEDFTPDGIKVRVYSQVGKSSQGKFALGVAVKTLRLYTEYFAEPYPLPKLDMVALPDFPGAMENYGLVTYSDSALLYDDHHSATGNKQRITVVVAHELAHQWFGNLVTIGWWTHLWLKEGFATWVSYLAADSLFPDWKIWTQFIGDQTTLGLRLDALAESHPIEVEINHTSEINEIFDAISYNKGASVIRMLQSYLGTVCFQKSLASYIKRFAGSNATTEDLLAVLEEESGEPVKILMDSWTKQKGYPLIHVKVEDQKLVLEQSQFLSSGSTGDGQWIVPVTLCYGSYDAHKKLLLRTKVEKLDLEEIIGSSKMKSSLLVNGNQGKSGQFWIKLNVDQTGFYRVKYDNELAFGLRYAIEAGTLSATDRFGILDDSFALCMAQKEPLSHLLSLMASYREELDFTVMAQIITVSFKVAALVADATPEFSSDTKRFLTNLLQYSAERLGWDPKDRENHLDTMLRGQVLTALAKLGHEEMINEASRRFGAFLSDRNTPLLSPDTRKAVYVAVMHRVTVSDKSGYESLLKVYRETDLSHEKGRVLSVLASSPDPNVVRDALDFLLSEEVRNQDARYGLGGISREGRDIAWIWLKENWDHISKRWGSGFLIGGFVSAVVSPFCSDEKAEEVEEFFTSRVKPTFARTLRQSLERVRINAKLARSIQSEQSLGEVVAELAYRKY